MESLTDAELGDVSTVHIHYLQEYRKVVAMGTSVVTRRGTAATEIQRLAAETVETLGLRIRSAARGGALA